MVWLPDPSETVMSLGTSMITRSSDPGTRSGAQFWGLFQSVFPAPPSQRTMRTNGDASTVSKTMLFESKPVVNTVVPPSSRPILVAKSPVYVPNVNSEKVSPRDGSKPRTATSRVPSSVAASLTFN